MRKSIRQAVLPAALAGLTAGGLGWLSLRLAFRIIDTLNPY